MDNGIHWELKTMLENSGSMSLEKNQKRELHLRALASSLDEIISDLSEIPEIKKIILHGLYSHGRRDLFTDLDLIVVMETERNILERTQFFYNKLRLRVDFDLLVYTPAEFSQMSKRGFLRQIIRNGKVMYEKNLDSQVVR